MLARNSIVITEQYLHESAMAIFLANRTSLFPILKKINSIMLSILEGADTRPLILSALNIEANFLALKDELFMSADFERNKFKGALGSMLPPKEIEAITPEEALILIADVLKDDQAPLIRLLPLHSVFGYRMLRLIHQADYLDVEMNFSAHKKALERLKRAAITRKAEDIHIEVTCQLGIAPDKLVADVLNSSHETHQLAKTIKSFSVLEHRNSLQRFNLVGEAEDVRRYTEEDVPVVAGTSSHAISLLTAVNVYKKSYHAMLTEKEVWEYVWSYAVYLVVSGYHSFNEVLFSAAQCLGKDYSITDVDLAFPNEMLENAEYQQWQQQHLPGLRKMLQQKRVIEGVFTDISQEKVDKLNAFLLYYQNSSYMLNAVNSEGYPLLHAAVISNNLAAVKLILAQPHVNINALDLIGRSALYYAVNLSSPELVELLLSVPAMVIEELYVYRHDNADEQISTLLTKIVASRQSDQLALFESIRTGSDSALAYIEKNKDFPARLAVRDCFDNTPLICAAYCGRLEIVRALLKVEFSCTLRGVVGIGLNAINHLGDSALISALLNQHNDIAHELLGMNDINVNIVNRYGETAWTIVNKSVGIEGPIGRALSRLPCTNVSTARANGRSVMSAKLVARGIKTVQVESSCLQGGGCLHRVSIEYVDGRQKLDRLMPDNKIAWKYFSFLRNDTADERNSLLSHLSGATQEAPDKPSYRRYKN